MNKLIFLFLSALLTLNVSVAFTQEIVFKKDLNLGKFNYYLADTANQTHTFFTLSDGGTGKVKASISIFNMDFDKIEDKEVIKTYEEAQELYYWWDFKGDEYKANTIGIHLKGKYYNFTSNIVNYTYNWKDYSYDYEINTIDKIKPVGLDGKAYEKYIHSKESKISDSEYAFLKTKEGGVEFVKINHDLSYKSVPIYSGYLKAYNGIISDKFIHLKGKDIFYVLTERKKDFIPEGHNPSKTEGHFITKYDKDLNVIKEVEIPGDYLFNPKFSKVENHIHVNTDFHLSVFDYDLNLIKEEKKTSSTKKEIILDDYKVKLYDYSESVSVRFYKSDKLVNKLKIEEKLYRADFFKLKGKKVLLLTTVVSDKLSNEVKYSVLEATDAGLSILKTYGKEDILVPKGDMGNKKMVASDKLITLDVYKTTGFNTSLGDAVIQTYFFMTNTTIDFYHYPRLLIVDNDLNLYGYEVYAFFQKGPVHQILIEYKENYYWIVIANSNFTIFSDDMYPKISKIDGSSKEIVKFMDLKECNLHKTFPVLSSFERPIFAFLSEDNIVYKISID
jgi:hypothetical protein